MLLYNCPKGTADNNPKGRKEKHGKYDSFRNAEISQSAVCKEKNRT